MHALTIYFLGRVNRVEPQLGNYRLQIPYRARPFVIGARSLEKGIERKEQKKAPMQIILKRECYGVEPSMYLYRQAKKTWIIIEMRKILKRKR